VVVSGYYYLLLLLGLSGMKGAIRLPKGGGALVANHIFDEWELLVQPRATKESHHSQQLYYWRYVSTTTHFFFFLNVIFRSTVLSRSFVLRCSEDLYYYIKILLFEKLRLLPEYLNGS